MGKICKKLTLKDECLSKRKEELAEKYNCLPKNIFIGDLVINNDEDDYDLPYIVFKGERIFKSDLVIIDGDLEIVNSDMIRLPKLKKVRNVEIRDSWCVEFPALEETRNFEVYNSDNVEARSLKSAHKIYFEDSENILNGQTIAASKFVSRDCKDAMINMTASLEKA